MSAIITDQFRILNSDTFISSVGSTNFCYYSFIGLTNSSDYDPNWDNSPLAPIDSFNYSNDIWDTIVGLTKINSDDVRKVIRKIKWTSGTTYDMYKNDISRDRPTTSNKSSLYSSNYYVLNANYRVYICLNNGVNPENPEGRPSLDEPNFTDLEPRPAGDSGGGYIWKYLYTINPNDIVKFETANYIPVPSDWKTNSQYAAVRENAATSGQLKMITISNRGSGLGNLPQTYSDIDIVGDGTGGKATVVVGEDFTVESVEVTSGGSGYTFGSLDLSSGGLLVDSSSTSPVFNVIIPPSGGHGSDIYRELGAFSVLLYSRIENDDQNPNFITGNKVARIGIVKNPRKPGSEDLLSDNKISGTKALKLKGVLNSSDFQNTTFTQNSQITQTIGTGKTAVGRVISYDNNTGVLKYWQDRALAGFNTASLIQSTQTPEYGYNAYSFTSTPEVGGSIEILGGTKTLGIDTEFSGLTTVINNTTTYNLGQEFDFGLSDPEVEKYSGDIIYVDNRPSITRSANQKEDIKVILQF